MRAAWRLATSSLSARPSRTVLLTLAVALSATLIAAVACAMASINASVRLQLDEQVGTAEARIRSGAGGVIAPSVLTKARAWEGVESAAGWLQDTLSLTLSTQVMLGAGETVYSRSPARFRATSLVIAFEPELFVERPVLRLIEGRVPEAVGEVVVDAMLAERLSWEYVNTKSQRPSFAIGSGRVAYLDQPAPELPATAPGKASADALNAGVGVRVGDTIAVRRLLRRDIPLTVVGIAQAPPLGGRPRAYVTRRTLLEITGSAPGYTEIELDLDDTIDPEAFVSAHADELEDRLLLTTTERVTTGVTKNMASSQLGFILAIVLAGLSGAFIILTGLTTGVSEQQRELGVLRAIGAARAQLASSQLALGLIIGGAGALLGLPVGVALAWIFVESFSEKIPAGLIVPPVVLAMAALGSLGAGLLGAAWPAWQAARVSVVRALASRSAPPRPRTLLIVSLVGAAGVLIQLTIVFALSDAQTMFWSYATLGLPAMFIGYFLLSVPLTLLLARVLAPVLTRLLRLPPSLLGPTVRQTPYRHGFTAGAMMVGLAMMVEIWAVGGAFLRDWLTKIEFPDAFVSGLALPPEAIDRIEQLEFVEGTSAISQHIIQVDAFGVSAIQSYTSWFFAFEPDSFFDMAEITFVDGDKETARQRLNEGGAVIVAREFQIAKGLGAGDTFTFRHNDEEYHLEIVGVVTSPGLELASKFFNIGDDFMNQAIHAVFGSRRDAAEIFGTDAVQLIQIDLSDDIDDATAVQRLREAVFGMGVLDVGSGRVIKEQLGVFVRGMLLVFSSVAIGSMLVACFGVANLIIAGIESRRFEFGVLRSIGAGRGVLVRLILGEAIIIAIAASILGTAMGLQGSLAAMRLYAKLLGIEFTPHPPLGALAFGWGVVLFMTLAASAPAILRLNRRTPLDLLAADSS